MFIYRCALKVSASVPLRSTCPGIVRFGQVVRIGVPLLGIGEVVGDDGQFGHTAYFFGKTEAQQRPWLDDILFVQVRLCAVHDARFVRIVGIGRAPCRVVALLVVVSHGSTTR